MADEKPNPDKEAARKKAIDEANAAAAKKKDDEAALKKAADAEAEKIMNSDIDANTEDEDEEVNTAPPTRDGKADAAYDLLRRVTLDFPVTTPNEFIVFGRGPHRVNLGALRALFSNPRN